MTALSLSALALLAALVAAGGVFRMSGRVGAVAPESYDDTDVREALAAALHEVGALRAEYEEFRTDINLAVAEGIKHVERAENRIKATVRRAREELEDGGVRSPGLEAEARDLFGGDEVGGPSEGVPAVHGDVDRGDDDFSAFPGTWHPEHLRAMRG